MNTELSGSAEPIYHIVYKTTNKLNGFIYIGVHTTNDLEDGYIGSGREFRRAVKEHGKENFTREILHLCETREKAEEIERKLVDREFLKRPDVYNRMIGGGQFDSTGLFTAKDGEGKCYLVSKDDPRYISGELVHISTGMVTVKDKEGNHFSVSLDDHRYLSGALVPILSGMVTVKDKDGKTSLVSKDDPRYISGELVHISTGMVTVKDKDGNRYKVSLDDPRYISGELVSIMFGTRTKHSEESKKKIGLKISLKVKGSLNPCFGLMWITNGVHSTRIKKGEKIPSGWCIGRIQKKS